MDWARAIEINQAALARIVAALIAMVGLQASTALARLPRPLYYSALRILRPAEAAVRRLVIIAARGVVVKPHAPRPMPKGLKLARVGNTTRTSFQLFDARKRFDLRPRRSGRKMEPRVWSIDASPLAPMFKRQPSYSIEPKLDDGMVGAASLGRRLHAIKQALDNLPAQVKRLARWQARRDRMASPKFRSPLRQGPPPGHRKKPKDDVDYVLKECHALARDALREDSS
jgi:hypothetical protein